VNDVAPLHLPTYLGIRAISFRTGREQEESLKQKWTDHVSIHFMER